MTAHNQASKEEIAKTVIMPGDPLRSKMIAETFLKDYKLVNNVRGVQGYTGYYKDKLVTVMASGMGNPSMGIYSYELFKFYDVDRIIRVGSIGAMNKDIPLKSLILGKRVFTKTNYNNFYINFGADYINCSKELLSRAVSIADTLGYKYSTGDILCSDTFYTDEDEIKLSLEKNLLGVEMEGASLYLNAERLHKDALCICTVSNNLITDEETTSEERQNSFLDMIKLSLEIAVSYWYFDILSLK